LARSRSRGARAGGRGRPPPLHPPRAPVPPRGRPDLQLPPAEIVAPDAGRGLRWSRAPPRIVSAGDRERLPVLQLRRRHAGHLTLVSFRRPAPGLSYSPMPFPYDEFDVSGIRTYSLAE